MSNHTCFILPPHISQNIANRGTPTQRARALRTLALSEQWRGRRSSLFGLSSSTRATRDLGKNRRVYDAKFGSTLPGIIIREETDVEPVADVAINEAYDGSGATYDLYSFIYGRNSIDAQGLGLISTVHYEEGYDNAFWNGSQMVYGDGDEDLPPSERLFNRFTICLDVIGHELTHGVTQYEAKLAYWGQPGALNESMSDVLGIMVKQWMLGLTVDQSDWIIGAGLFTPNVNGVGIRSMIFPGTAYDDPILGKDPQPDHMDNYQNIPWDNGGVHINSGIPNHAFCIAAQEIGGYAWEKAGMIWYVALRDKLTESSDFQDAANQTHIVAGELYGIGSLEQQAVRIGWEAVGIVPGEASKGCNPLGRLFGK